MGAALNQRGKLSQDVNWKRATNKRRDAPGRLGSDYTFIVFFEARRTSRSDNGSDNVEE